MPRQSRPAARPTPSRAPAKPATQQQQTRPATTYAAPTPAPHTPAPSAPAAAPPVAAPVSQGPGLFGQMASTAAGVAIGSSIGHAIGGLFSGGGSSSVADASPQAVAPAAPSSTENNSTWGNNCAGATQSFTKCMDEHQGNMNICGWYLEQLKACQAAASQY